MCLSNLVFLRPLIFLPPPNFHENMHDFRSPSFYQGRRLRPCFNGVDAPAKTINASSGPFVMCVSSQNPPRNAYIYTNYQDTLNFNGISFSVQTKDIRKFERQNSDISVNVISFRQWWLLIQVHEPSTRTPVPRKYFAAGWSRDPNVSLRVGDFFCRLLQGRTEHGRLVLVCNSSLNIINFTATLWRTHPKLCAACTAASRVLTSKSRGEEYELKFFLGCNFEGFFRTIR